MEVLSIPRNYTTREDLLAGKTLLVTGAGDGIGRTAAQTFARYGATVVLLGRTVSKLEAVYDEIETTGGPKPAIIEMDLATADEQSYQNLASRLANEFSYLDGIPHPPPIHI